MIKGRTLIMLVIVTGFSTLGSSCKSKDPFSGPHLPQEQMQKVMLDISLAESYSINVKDSLHKGGTKNWDSLAVYYKDIFAHHKISAEQFSQSLEWYKDHPDEMDTLFNKIIPVVSAWQDRQSKKN